MQYTRLQQIRKTHTDKQLRIIHQKAMACVAKLKSCEAELISCLQEVDELLVHRFLGYNSLFQYALKALRLSESQSMSYITVARKAKEFPALKMAVERGELTVSKAVRITSVMDDKSQSKWIELAKTLPRRQLEKEVANISPRAVVHEKARFLNANTLELSLALSEEIYKKIERVKDLLASKNKRHVNLEDTLSELVDFYLDRKDPVTKAKKTNRDQSAIGSTEPKKTHFLSKTEQEKSKTMKKAPMRPQIMSALKHSLVLRDLQQCQARLPDGSICGESRWLEYHHIQPLHAGGKNDFHNLITLCHAHHQSQHVPKTKELTLPGQ